MRPAALRRVVLAIARLDAAIGGGFWGASSDPDGGPRADAAGDGDGAGPNAGGTGGLGSVPARAAGAWSAGAGPAGAGPAGAGPAGAGSGGAGPAGRGSGWAGSGGAGSGGAGPATAGSVTEGRVSAVLAVMEAARAGEGTVPERGAEAKGPAPNGGGVEGMLRFLEATVDRATARLAAAQATTSRLLDALAHVPEGVVIADQRGEIVYRNPQAAMFVGARHGEALAERALSELLTAALEGRSSEENLELFSPTRRTLTIRARPLAGTGRSGPGSDGHGSGGPSGAVAIIEDVSERRRLEAVRRDFVANISHELKTPVGALSLVAETLEGEDDPVVVARLSRRMRAEAERLGRIIEDLLDLSRIEAEESPSRDPVPAYAVVGQAVDRSRPDAEHRQIKLELTEPPRHVIIRGDRRQLVAALHNLVDNAVKYSESGSAVQVSVAYDDEWIELVVADHGIGIPSKDLERIFERFYRVDRARSRDTGGTGLGLAIVRHVAGNHGGIVAVESREGEGSTFRLRLPNGTRSTSRSARGGRDQGRDDTGD